MKRPSAPSTSPHPNPALLSNRKTTHPLSERNPVLLSQGVALAFFIARVLTLVTA